MLWLSRYYRPDRSQGRTAMGLPIALFCISADTVMTVSMFVCLAFFAI